MPVQVTGGPVVKTLCSTAGVQGSIPGQESSTCHEVQPRKKKKKIQVLTAKEVFKKAVLDKIWESEVILK